MKTVIVNSGQGIESIALEQYGCLEGQLLIWQDNGIGPDTLLYPGQPLLIRDTLDNITGNNQSIAQYFTANAVRPNNDVEMTIYSPEYVEADYWDDDYAE